ncbi:hypothetical protein [Streptomyces sp. NPDC085665]|uniref:hypothetical protein n=1 Tax=Streptomyces sp. NPDC085665 TaxID=3365735 RepID=UPI0037D0BC8A
MTAADETELVLWGRCRSGSRWFWAARWYDDVGGQEHTEHGWSDREPDALRLGEAAGRRIAGHRPVTLIARHGTAASVLKSLNTVNRRAKPSTGGQAADPVEYLYAVDAGGEHNDFTAEVVAFRITRRTARRVYYVRDERRGEPVLGFVDRQALEADGQVRRAAKYAFEPYTTLYAAPPDLARNQGGAQQVDLTVLKQRMKQAHPDVGGTDAEFIAARDAYERARSSVHS